MIELPGKQTRKCETEKHLKGGIMGLGSRLDLKRKDNNTVSGPGEEGKYTEE